MDNPPVKQDLVAAILALREDVERQLLLDDLHVAQDRFARVAGEAEDVARPGRDARASRQYALW